jgi:hypothetical protein
LSETLFFLLIFIYMSTATGLTPGGSTHLHLNNKQNITTNNKTTRITNKTTQITNLEVLAMPTLCELYPGISLTSEEKGRKNLSQGSRRDSKYTHYQDTRTLQNPPTHPPTHTHTLQSSLKPPQYSFEIWKRTGSKFKNAHFTYYLKGTTCCKKESTVNSETPNWHTAREWKNICLRSYEHIQWAILTHVEG